MKRFFSDTSFWNQPIGPNPTIDPESSQLVDFMAKADNRGFWLSLHQWTIPVYEVDRNTPLRKVFRRFKNDGKGIMKRSAPYVTADHPMGHGLGFAADAAAGLVPIPDYAITDPEDDAHIALVDWDSGWIWDMWAARRLEDGNWEAYTGMKYRSDGSGVFDRADFAAHNGESIHPYGPSRAAGVPELAGLIMHDEILAGRIEHKLSFATQAAGLQRFVHPPACWTDGGWLKGLPEGAVLQLDPNLDLRPFNLSPHALIVARALQEYGAVCVDVGGGHPLYAEGLYGDPKKRTWDGLLDGNDLIEIKMPHYRVLKMENVVAEGMGRREPGTIYGGNYPE
jgi:hypothetical protein